MTITTSLLIMLTIILFFGGWTLAVAIGQAEEGYENALGFSLGKLPALPDSLVPPQAARIESTAPAKVPAFAPTHSSSDTTTQSVTIFVSGAGRTASALYRRHRRSTNSSAPFPVQSAAPFPPTVSASPFAIQCAATRARANQVDSAAPFPVNTKTAFGDGAAL